MDGVRVIESEREKEREGITLCLNTITCVGIQKRHSDFHTEKSVRDTVKWLIVREYYNKQYYRYKIKHDALRQW